jgi:hypothetical protein
MERLNPVFSFLGAGSLETFSLGAVLAGAFATAALAGVDFPLTAFAGVAEGFAGAINFFLAEGAGALVIVLLGKVFLAGGALGAAFLAGRGLADAFTGVFLAPEEGFTGIPEGFRDGEGLEIFFNGARLMPKSRARKVRLSLPSGQESLY